jgi:hypothetical protein
MELEDAWLALLLQQSITPAMDKEFKGLLLTDFDLIASNQELIFQIKVFLTGIKSRWPNRLILVETNFQTAKELHPLIDGVVFLGFQHAQDRNPQFATQIKDVGFRKVFTLDMVELQRAEKVQSAWQTAVDQGFIATVRNRLSVQETSSLLPPENNLGFLYCLGQFSAQPVVGIDDTTMEVNLQDDGFVVRGLQHGDHRLRVNEQKMSFRVIRGRTTVISLINQ